MEWPGIGERKKLGEAARTARREEEEKGPRGTTEDVPLKDTIYRNSELRDKDAQAAEVRRTRGARGRREGSTRSSIRGSRLHETACPGEFF